MTIEQFSELSISEMRVELNRVINRANARIRRLEETGFSSFSPVYKNLQRARGENPRFVSSRNTVRALALEYERAVEFLSRDTSTVAGTKKLRDRTEQYFGRSLTDAQISNIWHVYNMWKDSNTGLFTILGSSQVQELIGEVYSENQNFNDLLNQITGNAVMAYEETQPDFIPGSDIIWNLGAD